MDERRTKDVLDFLLSAYRARLAIKDTTDGCPFDFTAYLAAWKRSTTASNNASNNSNTNNSSCANTTNTTTATYNTATNSNSTTITTNFTNNNNCWEQLRSQMRKNFEPLLEEGLLDSILPYLTPSFVDQRHHQSSNSIKYDPYSARYSSSSNPNNCNILGTIGDLNLGKSIREKRKSRENSNSNSNHHKGGSNKDNNDDVEIVIHVCDESKGIREDFHCQQSILVKEMGYFTRVTVKGQRLKDMDISVHCDISVFDWLMKWVQHRANSSDTTVPPKLDPSNVIGLVVSADFLQMSALVSECLQYTYENLESIITSSPNLGCLSESLTARLAGYFLNAEIERRIVSVDTNDRITSRLYIQFILNLNETEADMSRGHYTSTATLFRCNLCGQYLTNDYAPKVPCSAMRFDCRGRIYANHFKDPNWSLGSYIKELKRELKTWRKVYWRLWATVHFFICSICNMYFPAKNLGACRFHPESAKQFPITTTTTPATAMPTTTTVAKDGTKESNSSNNSNSNLSLLSNSMLQVTLDQNYRRSHYDRMDSFDPRRSTMGQMKSIQDDTVEAVNCLPYGNYPCCKEPAYKYSPLPHINGCQRRDHVIDNMREEEDDSIINITFEFRDIILQPPNNSSPFRKIDWGGIIQMTAEKAPSITAAASNAVLEVKEAIVSRLSREQLTLSSSSTDSDSNYSDSEADSPPATTAAATARRKLGHHHQHNGAGALTDSSGNRIWESWIWNNDLTTRYNQDMQREREERLMMDLAALLSQRVPLDPSVGFHAAKFFPTVQRSFKNVGGSYVKIDQIWREQHQAQLAISKGINKTKGKQTTTTTTTATTNNITTTTTTKPE